MSRNVGARRINNFSQFDFVGKVIVDQLGAKFPLHKSVAGNLPYPASAFTTIVAAPCQIEETLSEWNGELVLPMTDFRIDCAISPITRLVPDGDVWRIPDNDRVRTLAEVFL